MSKIIFLNIPAHGHINPTLPIVEELVTKGNEVLYYSLSSFKEKIEATGATFKSYDIDLDIKEEEMNNFPIIYKTFSEVSLLLMDSLIEEVIKYNPDYIIHDSICPWGKYISEHLNIKAINSTTTFIFDFQNNFLKKEILKTTLNLNFKNIQFLLKGFISQIKLYTKYNLKHPYFFDILNNRENLNIVYTSKKFQSVSDKFKKNYLFIGTSIGNRNEIEIEIASEKTIIYISLGTIFGDKYDFYQDCFKALKDFDCDIILSLGGKGDSIYLKDIPQNFEILNYAPQLKILEQANLFITHGGMNSVHESLLNGVPMLVYPQQQEEKLVGKLVEHKQCGILLEKPTVKSLRECVKKILSNPTYIENSKSIGNSLLQSGGPQKAIQKIIEYINE